MTYLARYAKPPVLALCLTTLVAASHVQAQVQSTLAAPQVEQDQKSTAQASATLKAVNQLRTYEHGGDRSAVVAIEGFIRSRTAQSAKAVTDELLKVLTDPTAKPAGRQAAAHLLVGRMDDKSLEEIAPLLKDARVASATLGLFLAHPTPAADSLLVHNLGDVPANLRIGMMDVLGRRGSECVEALAPWLNSEDHDVQQAAARALLAIGTPKAVGVLKKAPSLPESVSQAVAVLSMPDRNAPVHVRIARATANIRSEAAAEQEEILALLKEPSAAVATAVLLARHGPPSLQERAWEALSTSAPNARTAYLGALPIPLTEQVRGLLVRAADSEDEVVASAALAALGKTGSSMDIPFLSKHVEKGRAKSDAARLALARLDAPEANAVLMQLAEAATTSASARAGLIEALGKRQHVPAFKLALSFSKDPVPALRSAALGTVGALAQAEDLPSLVELLMTAEHAADRRSLQRALASTFASAKDASTSTALIVNTLPRASEEVRPSLIAILASLDTVTALAALQGELADSRAERRRTALRALGSARNPATRSLLLQAAKTLEHSTERILAQSAHLDMLRDADGIQWDEKFKDFEDLWPHLLRDEERNSILASLRSANWSEKAKALLAKLSPPPATSP